MGAIAATETTSRPWYLYKLCDLIDSQGVTDWISFLSLIKGSLWWDFVCDIPSNKLWDELQ